MANHGIKMGDDNYIKSILSKNRLIEPTPSSSDAKRPDANMAGWLNRLIEVVATRQLGTQENTSITPTYTLDSLNQLDIVSDLYLYAFDNY